jgi:maleylpyruvate isomerase
MTRSLPAARGWMERGTQVLLETAAAMEQSYDVATALPGWTRKHLVAHVASNADALLGLVRWAATGVEAPMYHSPRERAATIERGTRLPPAELSDWLASSADRLAAAMDELTPRQWEAEVVTARGRTVPASELPWLRSREVWVHAVDLGGVDFADLPGGFLSALICDIASQRGLSELPEGPDHEVVGWLAGRTHRLAGVPDLGPWL